MRLRGRHYATGESIELVLGGGTIRAVLPASEGPVDHEADWLAPGFFDVQINGCDGHSFNSERLDVARVRHVVDVCARHGISQLCPTLVTNSFEAIRHGAQTIRAARERDPIVRGAVPAIHLEGPFISPEDGYRGAHPRQHVRAPDWDEFRRWQDAADGLIRMVTLAPEHDGALEFVANATRAGIVVALGHTAASGDRLRAAADAGARTTTHFGNGCAATIPRHDNVLWEQLAIDSLWASLITDGHHVPSSLARCVVRVKTPARLVLTCDASSLAGLPPGRYAEWGQEFEVLAEGKVVVPGTQYLAGSAVFTDVCIAGAMRLASVTLREAVDMASDRPRELMGLPPRALDIGQPAEINLLDDDENGLPRLTRFVRA